MKKIFTVVLVLSLCFVLTACYNFDDNAPISYSTNLGTDAYYNIAATGSILSYSPVVVCDGTNVGDVYIRVLDDKGQLVGSVKTVSPGETVILDEIPPFSGTCTIQGKAADSDGIYTLHIR